MSEVLGCVCFLKFITSATHYIYKMLKKFRTIKALSPRGTLLSRQGFRELSRAVGGPNIALAHAQHEQAALRALKLQHDRLASQKEISFFTL